jgi:hypothetical protein
MLTGSPFRSEASVRHGRWRRGCDQHPISPSSQHFDRKPPDSGLQPPDERGGNACGTKQNQQSFGRALPTLQLTA